MLSRDEPFKPHRPRGGENTAPANSSRFLTAWRSCMELSGRGSSQE
jgi:hypothetical protein